MDRDGFAPMKAFYGELPSTESLARPKVTLGTFDGVHLGHQRVLRELLAWARSDGGDAVVVTFDRKPRDVLAGRPSDQITSVPHRLLLFERLGMDAALVLRFDEKLASCEPESFVKETLADRLSATGVLLGHDTRFGRNGRGDMALLARLGEEFGFRACSVPVVEIDGAPVSSTRVRAAIQEGDLRMAGRMLARRPSVLGTVVRGTGRGEKIGCRTANLDLHHEVRPPEGVYATRTLVGGAWRDSVTNIGRAPTLRRDGPAYAGEEIVVETHIFDFSDDLYGKDVEVQFVEFIRDEEVFTSAEALAARIATDVRRARARLAVAGESGEPAR